MYFILSILFLYIYGQSASSSHCYYSGFQVQSGFSAKMNYNWNYASSQCSTRQECAYISQMYATDGGGNIAGYFGMQTTTSGKVVLFSLWDYSDSIKSAQGVDYWCSRFGGEGEGAHCIVKYNWQIGVTYEMEVYVSEKTSSYTTLVGIVTDKSNGARTYLGSIKSQVVYGRGITSLNPYVSFMEYYMGGTFYTAASMSGPYVNYNYGPNKGQSDCYGDPPGSVSGSSPNLGSGKPVAYYQKGPNVQRVCGNMWYGSDSDSSQNSTSVWIPKFANIYKHHGDEVWKYARPLEKWMDDPSAMNWTRFE